MRWSETTKNPREADLSDNSLQEVLGPAGGYELKVGFSAKGGCAFGAEPATFIFS